MSLRTRLGVAFALVALLTAGLIALAAPTVVGRGFARLATDAVDVTGPGLGQGAGRGPGPMAGLHPTQVEQETVLTLGVIALVAAAGATLIGVILAGRIVRPLVALGTAASAVAHGNLDRRSGLADRADEIGSLGRSFDAMAAGLAGAEDARRRFFADAAHELKTPLSVIDATISALLDGVYDHDDRHLRTIREQSHLLGRIVDDLRTVSLAETAALPLRREPVAIDDIVRAAVGDATIRAGATGVSLRVDGASSAAILGDRDRLRQVLAALLDNALRHTPPGGEVTVTTTSMGETVRVRVQDTGPGIDPEHLPNLFDRFYQVDPARDRSTGTSGLGLAVVRALVLAHGGRVGAENVEGGGASFWFDLPSTGPAAAHDIPADDAGRHHHPIAREVHP